MTVNLKATLTKNADGSFTIMLIGDQPESSKAFLDFALNQGPMKLAY